jgi:glutamyl-tRNA reductase
MAHVTACGLTHRSAPLRLLESMPRGHDVDAVLDAAREQLGADGAVVLSTCNRFEVYLRTERPLGEDQLARFLGSAAGADADRLRPYSRTWIDGEAVRHLFAVAAGLDSRVLGEEEILGQVRTAVTASVARGALHADLASLFHWANRAARRSRGSAGFSAGHRSVALHAVKVADSVLGGLAGRHVVLLGAGQIAARAARSLVASGAVVEALTRNPTRTRPNWPAVPVRPLTDLTSVLARADLLLCATTAKAPLVDADTIRRARAGSHHRLCVIDVSVPRTADVGLLDEPDIVLLDLDSLAEHHNPAPADTRMRAAERTVREEAEQFLTWQASRAAGPFIDRLQSAAASICAESVRRAKHGQGPSAEAALEHATDHVAAALLHGPIVAVRSAVVAGDLPEAERLVTLFERRVMNPA